MASGLSGAMDRSARSHEIATPWIKFCHEYDAGFCSELRVAFWRLSLEVNGFIWWSGPEVLVVHA